MVNATSAAPNIFDNLLNFILQVVFYWVVILPHKLSDTIHSIVKLHLASK